MALDLPATKKEIVDRSKTDVLRELETSNPFLRNSALASVVTATALRNFDFYLQLRIAERELIWSTATGEFLDLWASTYGVFRLAATPAGGITVATGASGNMIASGLSLFSSDGLEYLTTDNTTVAVAVVNVSTLTSAATLATCATVSPHGYASGLNVTVAGANEAVFNGTFEIAVTSDTEYQYTLPSAFTGSATGTITSTATFASVPIESVTEGADTNQDAGTELTFATPLVGVDSVTVVDFGAIGGGTALESDEDFRARFQDRTQNPVAQFSDSAIVAQAKLINGVTRVFVQSITPLIGMVTIYFVRDNDESIIPTSSEVEDVFDSELLIKPAQMWVNDLIVAAPTAVPVDFVFTSLTPDSPTMRDAVTANLGALFREQTVVGVTLEEDAYRSVIWATIDPANGQQITQFDLSAPIGDIPAASNEIQTHGTDTYP